MQLVTESIVGLERVQRLLECHEVSASESPTLHTDPGALDGVAVRICDATFDWAMPHALGALREDESGKMEIGGSEGAHQARASSTLVTQGDLRGAVQHLSFQTPRGTLVAIIGSVGAGKVGRGGDH